MVSRSFFSQEIWTCLILYFLCAFRRSLEGSTVASTSGGQPTPTATDYFSFQQRQRRQGLDLCAVSESEKHPHSPLLHSKSVSTLPTGRAAPLLSKQLSELQVRASSSFPLLLTVISWTATASPCCQQREQRRCSPSNFQGCRCAPRIHFFSPPGPPSSPCVYKLLQAAGDGRGNERFEEKKMISVRQDAAYYFSIGMRHDAEVGSFLPKR